MAKGDQLYYKALQLAGQQEYDTQEVISLLIRSIEEYHNAKAAYALATWYLFGKHVGKNFKKAFELLEKSIAWEPNKEAYFDIAVCYETGKGTPKDLEKAFECYLLSALYGEPKAKYEVGRCYYYGIGVPKNIELGREICEQFPEK